MTRARKKINDDDVLLTHLNCIDGACCAALFVHAGGRRENVNYVPAGGGVAAWVSQNKKIVNSDCTIYIADVSTDNDTAVMFERRGNVRLVDHHKSALRLKSFTYCRIDMSCCGCSLLADELFGAEFGADVPEVIRSTVRYVNDFDMWKNELPDTQLYVCYFDMMGQEALTEKMIDDFNEMNDILTVADTWSYDDRRMLRSFDKKRQRYISETAARARKIVSDDVTYGCVFVSSHRSEVLNRVLENDSSIDVAAGFLMEEAQVSLRSRKGGIDVSKIAERFGGGGHENAAAFTFSPFDTFGDVL